MGREVHLERVVGRRVFDADGRKVGRLEEVHIERQGDRYVVSEYLIGTSAFLERLSIESLMPHETGRARGGYRAWWHQVDLTDPARPRLCCRLDELRKYEDGT